MLQVFQCCLISPALYVSIFEVESRILQAEKSSLLVLQYFGMNGKVEGLTTMLNKRLMKTRKQITEFIYYSTVGADTVNQH